MTRTAPLTQLRFPTNSCVWMDAGVLAYRLCDRGFDCAHCPLDAALRGHPLVNGTGGIDGGAGPAFEFPGDRLYSAGHLWVGESAGAADRLRVGLDALAATLVGRPLGFAFGEPGRAVAAGEAVCELELMWGALTIGLPLAGRFVGSNPALDDNPGLVHTDPYRSGWLLEWTPTRASGLGGQSDALEASHRAQHDARHFCRLAALRLLEQTRDTGAACLVDTDIRRLLGDRVYLRMLKELIH
ncbi:MAG: hypothetical protein H6810_00170 [Phycisphaeraceae bacterium]|nr:MAG: hypothetical protein H6810_00170 [Phycisphaeraceae bacterium]